MNPTLSVHNLSKSFGAKTALDGANFDVYPGETLALLGPSGCGKSTLLNLVAGLEQADGGEIAWKGRSLADIPAHQRGFGLMFQDYVLFPHMTVAGNVAFGLEMAEMDAGPLQDRVEEMLALVGLSGYAHRNTDSLSGGEQQRVALARALAPKPQLLMLDEPLAALDRPLREQLLGELQNILKSLHQTAIYVTHDQEEAFSIAHRVAIMRAGRIEQVGTPREIYALPGNEFVAGFLGFKNILDGRMLVRDQERWVDTAIGSFLLPPEEEVSRPGPLRMLVRPDAATLTPGPGARRLKGRVLQKTFRGSRQVIVVDLKTVALEFEFSASTALPVEGQPIEFGIRPEGVQGL